MKQTNKSQVLTGGYMEKIEEIIKNTNEENQNKVNWTKAWSTKYPILKNY